MPNSTSLNPGTAEFAYSVTFVTRTPVVLKDTFDLIRKGLTTTAGGEFKLEIKNINGSAIAVCTLKDSATVRASVRGTTNLDDGKVHTATCTKTSTGLSLKVDGLAPTTDTVTAGLGSVSNSSDLIIGAKPDAGDDWFLGTMYEASVRTL